MNKKTQTKKNNASKCTYKGISFDSILERDTYMVLSLFFGADNVEVKPVLQIIPPNKIYSALNWKPDFMVDGFIFEAKGLLDRSFREKWRVIGLLREDIFYNVVFVVGDFSSLGYLETFKRVTRKTPIKLSQLRQYLQAKFNSEGEF